MDAASVATTSGVLLPADDQVTAAAGQPATTDGQLSFAVGAIVQIGGAVAEGAVRLTEEAAQGILQVIGSARTELATLQRNAEQDLGTPLLFGNNFVGRAIAERLRGVASEGAESAVGVVTSFAEVLDQVEATVRAAAGLLTDTDAAAGQAITRAGGQR
ncbi:hypothetical protein [Goodfellowiella coeruleoviolacea]|uniref:hypothetical protein n=1 Tax=Goodfellowiella coeruleoviolacea TaxID=334858 RepID=UPI0020A3F67D|nr:hypothetical protein [Goodfellowiella coeruleoviolacea]